MSTLSDLWPKWSVFECVKTSLSTIQQIINVSDGLLSGQVFEVPLLQAEKNSPCHATDMFTIRVQTSSAADASLTACSKNVILFWPGILS